MQKYMQHNHQTQDGGEILATHFARISKSNPRVSSESFKTATTFDIPNTTLLPGELALKRSCLTRATRPSSIGIISSRDKGPTDRAGAWWRGRRRRRIWTRRKRIDIICNGIGTDGFELEKTRTPENCQNYVDEQLIQHNPNLDDGFDTMRDYYFGRDNSHGNVQYQTPHRVLAEGDFVLTLCEGNDSRGF